VSPPPTRLAALVCIAVASCTKGSSRETSGPAASSSAPPAAAANIAKSAAPVASASEAAPSAWSGSYSAKVGAVNPPANAKEKTWTDDPGSAAVGKGTLDLSIAEPRGETTGETKGPLGEMTIAGLFDGHELRANLRPKNPKADGAMTGFMVLTAEGSPAPNTLKGTMRVSSRDARVVREAEVELTKK